MREPVGSGLGSGTVSSGSSARRASAACSRWGFDLRRQQPAGELRVLERADLDQVLAGLDIGTLADVISPRLLLSTVP
jgi:hypothetical protein